jgi:hypothetical protein
MIYRAVVEVADYLGQPSSEEKEQREKEQELVFAKVREA